MIGPFLLTSGFELAHDLADQGIDLFRFLRILDGSIDQPFHILLALLPVGVALAASRHPVVMVMRGAPRQHEESR